MTDIRITAEAYRQTRAVSLRRPGSTADFIFFLIFLVFLCLTPVIRFYGGALFLIFIFFTFIYILLKNALFFQRSLIIFTGIGILYIVLSYLDTLPDAWTEIKDLSTIPRQSFFVLAFYPLVAAARRLWKHVLSSRHAAKYFLALLIAAVVVTRIVGTVLVDEQSYLSDEGFVYFQLSGLGNEFLPAYMAIGYLVFVRLGRSGSLISLPVGAALFLSAALLQNQLVSIAFVCLGWVRHFRWPLVIAILAALALTGVGLYLIPQFYRLDPNLGVRLLFIRDALTALWESRGLGVGFGKEAVVNQYALLGWNLFADPLNTNINFMYLSTHNSFIAMFYRLGIVGGGAFAWFFFVDCFPRGIANLYLARHASFVFFAAFLAIFSNVAIESPTYIVGVAFACGYLLACKDRYGKGTENDTMLFRDLERREET